jgi:hypothetical protein
MVQTGLGYKINNIYYLQLGFHPVAVDNSMCAIYNVRTKFNSGRLHEKHVVATWNFGNHLSICY